MAEAEYDLRRFIDEVETLLKNATYGLSALKTLIDALALEATLNTVDSVVDDIFKGVTPIAKQVATDTNNSQWQFKTTLTETVQNYFNGMYIIFSSGTGTVKYQTRKIVGYDGDNKIIRVDRPFTVTPPDNEWFFILPRFSSPVDIEDEFGWDEFLGSSPSKRYTPKETEGGIANDAVAVSTGELQLTGEATVGGVKGSVWIRTRKPLLKFPLNKKVIVDIKQKTSTAPSANDYSNIFLILKEPNGNRRPHDWEDGILLEVARYTGNWKWMAFQKTAAGSWTNLYDSGVKSGADEDVGTWRIIFNDDDGKDRILLKLKADKCFSEVWNGNFNLDWEENEGYVAYELDTLTTDNKTVITYYCKTTVIDKSLSPATLVTEGTIITDGSNTSSTFKTDLVDTNDEFYNGLTIVFKSGSNMSQARKISDYNGTTHFITVAKALQATPAADDLFTIIPIWTDPASPATEAKQDTIIGYIDAEVGAIKTETDKIPTLLTESQSHPTLAEMEAGNLRWKTPTMQALQSADVNTTGWTYVISETNAEGILYAVSLNDLDDATQNESVYFEVDGRAVELSGYDFPNSETFLDLIKCLVSGSVHALGANGGSTPIHFKTTLKVAVKRAAAQASGVRTRVLWSKIV